ncbi:cysteine methyltransferase [Microbispora sp. KK1-11]|nr:MGMT family protein [Microbispora sp. KK1-11]TQS24681.1 cysteine methyltransferase [Microbispora sp. KK1-11]
MERLSDDRGQPPPYAERVLDLVERIPPGTVMSYGDVAEYLGEGGPRQVGRVMSLWGGAVPWWRVIHADGTPAPGLEAECLARWREEGTPLRGARADMRTARWDGRDRPSR